MSTADTKTFENSQPWAPSVSPWLITIAVMLATFMVVLDSSIANVALPQMAGSFSATQDESMWILTSYLIANGIILPSTAWFSGLLGRKNFLITCIVTFTIASAICGLSNSLEMMILARVLQGLGGGALMPISQSILLESFPKEKHGMAMAIFGFGVILAPVIGPTLGGWITDNFSWHWIFFINIPIGVLAIVFSQMFIEDPPYMRKGNVQKIDYIGFGSLILWLVTLQFVLDNGQKSDWFASAWVCWTSLVSFASMVFFFVWELNYKNSIIDLKVFKDRNFAVGTILVTMVNAILYSSLAILPLFLQSLLGYTAYNSGLAITPRGMGCLATIILAGIIANKIDARIQIGIGFLLLAISNFLFGTMNLGISMQNIIIPNIICGAALGLTFIPLTTLSFNTLKNEQMTNASGIQSLMKNIGGAIGTSIVSTMIIRGAQVHQNNLVSHLTSFNPVFMERIGAIKHMLAIQAGPVVAEQKANFLIYIELLKQSSLGSYVDSFRLFGLLCLCLIPAVFVFRKAKSSKDDNSMASLH